MCIADDSGAGDRACSAGRKGSGVSEAVTGLSGDPAEAGPFRFRAALAGFAMVLGLAGQMLPANAQRSTSGADMPVVLELYTSQGCAACPPADEMLAALAPRDDVIAMSLHVDYWDYIGWADPFADPEHGERQKRYARRHGFNTVYTPQVVIDGVELLEGFRVMQIMELIEARRARPAEFSLELSWDGESVLQIEAAALDESEALLASRAAARPMAALATTPAEADQSAAHEVMLVHYMPHSQVEITDGENAGRMADHANIVTSWRSIGTWDPRMPLSLSVPEESGPPLVVIIQQVGQGRIVAAARLR